MLSIRKFTRIIAHTYKSTTFIVPSLTVNCRLLFSFSESKQPTSDSIKQAQQQSKDFYSKHVENIIELKRV